MTEVLRLAAFTRDPEGGNPAGVVIGDAHPSEADMQRIAAEVGYSETAFLEPGGDGIYRVRYFSPAAEVPFCGHATIAAGVVLAERHGPRTFSFETMHGLVLVETQEAGGAIEATLVSVPPKVERASDDLLDAALGALGWRREDLDPSLPPARSFAGSWHLILALADRETLASLDYDFEALRDLMLEDDLTTVQLVWRESATAFHARDPFPVGAVDEDPATGSAAAALGAYLRERGELGPSATFTIRQGEDMGRPSLLTVELREGEAGVRVRGTAVPIG